MKHISKKVLAVAVAISLSVTGAMTGSMMTSYADSDTKYEFEDATITGTSTEVETSDAASGGKFVHLKNAGDTITLTVTVEETGMYDMNICYITDGGAKTQKMYINGEASSDLSFSDRTEFAESTLATVKLQAGENEIQIVSYWGWTQLDYMTLTEPVYPELTASSALSDKNATEETQSLMNYLASVYGEHVISGQQEIYMYGPHDFEYEFNYIEETTGELPAIRGFDFLNCNPLYGSDDQTTERILSWVTEKNGIATASWHITVPKDFENYTLGDSVSWSNATYVPDETDFDPSQILVDGSKEQQYWLLCLDGLAQELLELQAANVPLIFRPLHEAEGGGGESGSWFWWGKAGSSVYKQLWIYSYEVLTEEYGLHNLIWEWNSYTYDTSTDWYPGDEYVDLIAYDKYNCTDWSTGSAQLVHNVSAIGSTFYDLVEQYDGQKMIAMSENDSIPTLENFEIEKAGWLYFCPWYDGGSDDTNFLTNSIFNDPEDLKTIYQSDYCITLDELPTDLYGNGGYVVTTTTKEGETTETTTTQTTVTTEPITIDNAIMAEVTASGTNYNISFDQEMGENVCLILEVDDNITYANGCLGISVTVDATDYWISYQWEVSESGEVWVNLSDDLYNITYNNGADEVTDEETIAALLAEAQKQTDAQVQVWWANDGNGKETDTAGVVLTAAYIPDSSETETTEATTETTEETTTEATEETTTESTEETTTEEVTEETTTEVTEETTTEATEETTTEVTVTPTGSGRCGDVDENGTVNLADAILLSKAAVNLVDLTNTASADCNCDGEVDGNDALILLKFVVQMIDSLPYTES